MNRTGLTIAATIILSIFIALALSSAQRQPLAMLEYNTNPYEKEWAEIDSLNSKGLPQSALQKVEALYERAKNDSNPAQIVKTLLYRGKYTQQLNEEGQVKSIEMLERELVDANSPEKSVLQSILAQVYIHYVEANRWKLDSRTEMATGDIGQDIRTWTTRDLLNRAHELFAASVKSIGTQQVPLGAFDAILQKDAAVNEALRPTLYDFLAHEALDFLTNDRSYVTRPSYYFQLDDEKYFAPAAKFANLELTAQDTASPKLMALHIFQNLLRAHRDPNHLPALIDADLKRLQFVHQSSVLSNKDDIYLNALEDLAQQHPNHQAYAEIVYFIARHYTQLAAHFNPNAEDENLRGYYQQAESLCEEAIEKFPNSYGATLCKSLLAEIRQKSLQFRVEEVNLPNRPFRLSVNYRNIDQLYLGVVSMTEAEYTNFNNLPYRKRESYIYKLTPDVQWQVSLPAAADHHSHVIEVPVEKTSLGRKMIILSEEPFSAKERVLAYAFTQISNLGHWVKRENMGALVAVVSRDEGIPQSGVEVSFWKQQYQNRKTTWQRHKVGTTDANGFYETQLSKDKHYRMRLQQAQDVLMVDNSYYGYYDGNSDRSTQHTHLFTDRAIYRPGQTIYFKGILMRYDRERMPNIVANHRASFTLFDANHQKVTSIELTSNSYGSVQGVFTLPKGLLNGQFFIRSDFGNTRTAFSVEEYKRPKFQATFEPLVGSYALGNNIVIKGKAEGYAGNSISDATVTYRVMRKAEFPYWRGRYMPYFFSREPVQMAAGHTTTDANGAFEISFEAKPDRSIDAKYQPTFYYSIEADVTDLTGETRTAQSSISVGYQSLLLTAEIPDKVPAQKDWSLPIQATNLNGEKLTVTGQLVVEKLQAPDRYLRDRYWSEPDVFLLSETEHQRLFPHDPYRSEHLQENWSVDEQVLQQAFHTGKKDSLLLHTHRWSSGHYRFTLTAKDPQSGKPVKSVHYVTIYNKDKKVPKGELLLGFTDQAKYAPGDNARLTLGTAYGKWPVLVERIERGEVSNRQWLSVQNWETLSQSIQELHRGNAHYRIYGIRYNRTFKENYTLIVPWSNKELQIEYATFRDKLSPGQEEEWILKVSGPLKDKVAAEMVATLYDASLDAFRANSWNLRTFPTFGAGGPLATSEFGAASSSRIGNSKWLTPSMPRARSYPSLNWFGFQLHRYAMRSNMLMLSVEASGIAPEEAPPRTSTPPPPPAPSLKQEELSMDASNEMAERKKESDNKEEIQETELAAPVRTNLKETVFFFPQLETDADGNVLIKFTMNEALTRWKFMALAHTQDLKSTQISRNIVTQKELMVMPNPPRFLREFDKIMYAAKVVNMNEQSLSGTADLELLNALDMEPVQAAYELRAVDTQFDLQPGESKTVRWQMKVPSIVQVPALVHRVTARSATFSDGEEAALPVLTNRMLVTESLPLPIRGRQEKTFTFDRMTEVNRSSSMENHSYTLEFTSNPAWYAVQSLPYIMEYPHACTEQVFNRYFANTLATSVANSHPRIKQVFDNWSRIPESASNTTAFSSALERNQELKYALLEETPWVLQSQNQAQQQRNIALLFDLNRMADEQQVALRTLQERQLSNGAFSWFPGGQPDIYMTQYIVQGMGHLDHLQAFDNAQSAVAMKILKGAIRFADDELKERYAELEDKVKKKETTWEKDHLSALTIHYLYMRSFFMDQQTDSKTQKIIDYYLGQAQQHWLHKSLYQQGLLALALHRYQRSVTTSDMLKSFKERSMYHEEMGRYWKADWGYFWYQLPIETQSLMIEVFSEVGGDEQMVEELKIWLLKNKQTHHWETTKATASAVYALLSQGDNWLLEDEPVDIRIGDEDLSIQAQQAEAGTGYFKVNWEAADITQRMAKVHVDNPNKHIAWGAVYWQYFENLDRITSFEETPLTLRKQLFSVQDSDTGEKLHELQEGDALKVGDKLKVRIELRVDRNMEYVHMRDMRASGFEPINVFSGYRWQGGLGYYESTKDAATHFFFNYLPKGTYVFEYPMWVQHEGDFSNGITTIQCMYAPEFTSHSEGIRVLVN